MDYELIDSGDGEKLERFGEYVLARPDPQALWRKLLSEEEWKKADGTFTRDEKSGGNSGGWSLKAGLPSRWSIDFSGLKFWIKPTPFKHVGLFPEQATNWDWMREKIKQFNKGTIGQLDTDAASADIEVLNLFGYTGGATLACAQAGAKVVHIDGSKAAITWARENAELSGLEKKPVRWILDDARAFVKREIKRGRKYHGIIMDPPSFGHGPDNEVWKLEEDFMKLIEACYSILADKTPTSGPLFFLVNGYAAGYSAMAYENALRPLVAKYGGKIEKGELTLTEKSGADGASGATGRSLPCGIFARWTFK
ncbi:MAG: class I SAM-dependent methyltransferase [Candidatus Taylorbacteria bacterium]